MREKFILLLNDTFTMFSVIKHFAALLDKVAWWEEDRSKLRRRGSRTFACPSIFILLFQFSSIVYCVVVDVFHKKKRLTILFISLWLDAVRLGNVGSWQH